MIKSEVKTMKDYVKRIHDLRQKKRLSEQDAAKYLNVSEDIYRQYELGTRDLPTQQLIKLSELFGVSIDYILCITDKPERLY